MPNSGDRRLNTITYNAAPNSNETITTDDAFRVTARTDGTGKVESYTYDNADRLSYGTVTAPTSYTETYGLNNADFISSKSGEPVTANNWAATNTGSVNAIGTLTPTGGSGRVYSYDTNGNVRSDGVNTYTWDAENRLLTVTNIATGRLSSFTYDGLGRRVAITETTGGVATKTGYLWCGTTLCAAYNAGGITTARYQPEGEVQYSGGTATPYYYATDHLGSVTSTTSASGATLGTLATDAYGLTLSQTGTTPTFGYAGMFLHSASGLYLTLYRAYDPYSGRWLSRDPSGEFSGNVEFVGWSSQGVGTSDVTQELLGAGANEGALQIGTRTISSTIIKSHVPEMEPAFGLLQSKPKASLSNTVGTNLYTYVEGNPITNIDTFGLDLSSGSSCSGGAGNGDLQMAGNGCLWCGAPGGAVGPFAPYCPDCYGKSLKPDGGVPPLVPFVTPPYFEMPDEEED